MSQDARWYVVHTYNGYENKVAGSIMNARDNRQMDELICEVKVPFETVTEVTENRTREVERKLFPGYVLVKMVMTDETWYVVRNIRGVTGFVGPGSKPVPLTEDEVERLGVEVSSTHLTFAEGDNVSINNGSFAGYIGVVKKIDKEKGVVTVTISMMGKDVPVELNLNEVSSLG